MIARVLSTLVVTTAVVVGAAVPPPAFGGHWTFHPERSRNIGMMASMKISTVIVQTSSELKVDDNSDFNGQADTQHTVYDLTGKSVSNSPIMGGTATTRSHWDGSRLVTEWESPGSIEGTTVKRTELRYLSPDGKTMFVESSRSGQPSMVMVFTRER
jgi:hypothetical protein